MIIREVLALLFFLSAVIFALAGLAGLFRYIDPYNKLQSGSLCGTTAVLSTMLGALLLADSFAMVARVLLIIGFFLISSPTGTHIVARFTWNSGIYPMKEDRK